MLHIFLPAPEVLAVLVVAALAEGLAMELLELSILVVAAVEETAADLAQQAAQALSS